MFVVILLYDQLLFRPLLAWSRKFQPESSANEENVRPWFLIMLQRARLFDLVQAGLLGINHGIDSAIARLSRSRSPSSGRRPQPSFERLYDIMVLACALAAAAWLVVFIRAHVDAAEIGWVFVLGMITAVRVLVLIAVASLIWVPIGVAIGLRPRLADRVQPIVAVSRRLSGKSLLSGRGRADPEISPQPGNLAEPADDPRHPVVHSVQCHRRRRGVAGRTAARGAKSRGQAVVMVAAGDAAGDLPGLCDGRGDRRGRVMEREHRRRNRAMGEHRADRDGHRRLYRPAPPPTATAPASRSASACCASTFSPSTGCCGDGSTISPPNGCGSTDAWQFLTWSPCTMPAPLLRAEAVCKTYQMPDHHDRLVLDHVDFTLRRWRDRRDPRQVGLGQIDFSAHPRRPDSAKRRRRSNIAASRWPNRRTASRWCFRAMRCFRG